MTKTILILAANPKGTPQLRLDQEIREIDNGLERAQKRNEFTLKQKLAARPVDVRRAMLDYKPNIVHFCGHGSGEEGIAFEDENGKAKLVSTEVLAGFFELFADKVECVVLNACYSEAQAEAIAEHISCVTGMTKAVGDAAAIEFAVAFYDSLGAGESFEFAHRLACNAIQWVGISEHLTPVLKRKAQQTPTLDPNLLALLNIEKDRCRELNVAFLTPNLLLSLMAVSTSPTRLILNKACPEKVQVIVDGLRRYRPDDTGGTSFLFADFDWYERKDVQAARHRAKQEGKAVIDARHLLLGFLDTESQTRIELQHALGKEGFENLRRIAESAESRTLTPGVSGLFNPPVSPPNSG
jgi:hypothetical protein